MRRVALVRRRDGSTVPFDQHRILEVVDRALLAAGGERSLVREVASMVEVFLGKSFHDEIPTTDDVDDMVGTVLIDTGHAAAAKAFILHREEQRRLRAIRAARSGIFEPSLFEHGVIQVDDGAAGVSTPFSRERLARMLVAETGATRGVADEAAADVETKLRRASVSRAPSATVRSLAEAALIERAPELDLRRRGATVLSSQDVAAALRGRVANRPVSPRIAAQHLGGAAMQSHALFQVLPSDAAEDHLGGALHVHGLTAPSALFRAALAPADVLHGQLPHVAARAPEGVGRSSRRLAAALGRGARWLNAAVVDRVYLHGVADAFGLLTSDASREAVSEEAWHVLHETAAEDGERAPRLVFAVPREGGDAGARFASAVLRALHRPDGLPPRATLPRPVVQVCEAMLADGPWRRVLERAAAAAAAGARVRFQLLRGGAARGECADRRAVGGRVTLNLPRAAARVGRRNFEGFQRACDALVDRAVRAHTARRELLAHAGGGAAGPLTSLLRGTRGRQPLVDLSACTWSVAVSGLNEALQHLTGFELHDGAEQAARDARRVLKHLAMCVREAGLVHDLQTTLDADESVFVARRFFDADARTAPVSLTEAFPGRSRYTPGVRTRDDGGADLLTRIVAEEALHESLGDATLSLGLAPDETGGAAGLVAVLTKLLRVGSVDRVEVGAW